jgi:hypothetical protein
MTEGEDLTWASMRERLAADYPGISDQVLTMTLRLAQQQVTARRRAARGGRPGSTRRALTNRQQPRIHS